MAKLRRDIKKRRRSISGFLRYKNLLENAVRPLAKNGDLSKAAEAAIRLQSDKGVAAVFMDGDLIVKLHADGTREILAQAKHASKKVIRRKVVLDK